MSNAYALCSTSLPIRVAAVEVFDRYAVYGPRLGGLGGLKINLNRLLIGKRDPRDAGRRFSFECLPIQTSLAGDHKIDIFHFHFESDCFGNNVEARPNYRTAKTHQTEPQPARCAGAWLVAIIKTEVLPNDIRKPR